MKPKDCPNSYIAELDDVKITPDLLRRPTGPRFTDLVHEGTIVKTSYGTGPYTVQVVSPRVVYGAQCFDLVVGRQCGSGHPPYGKYYLNELVAVNGRLLHLFKANDDEVVVVGQGEAQAHLIRPWEDHQEAQEPDDVELNDDWHELAEAVDQEPGQPEAGLQIGFDDLAKLQDWQRPTGEAVQ